MKYYEGCEEITREKTRDFQAKMKLGYDFKKAYAARRAWEFYNHPEVAGRCYVAVGGLDSITLFLFLRSIGIDVPATSVSMLEDRSIQRVHKALGVKGLLPVINQKTKRPYNKVEVIREYGFPVLSKEIAEQIRHAAPDGEKRNLAPCHYDGRNRSLWRIQEGHPHENGPKVAGDLRRAGKRAGGNGL